jgi:hypothetical protein
MIKLATRAGRYIAEETTDLAREKAKLEREMEDGDIDDFKYKRRYGPNRNMTGSERLLQITRILKGEAA